MNNKQKGLFGEQAACHFLENKGMSILFRNYRCRLGEIDLIALEGDVLVFVEVKYRNAGEMTKALEAVGPLKQQRIRRVAMYFLMERRIPPGTPCRFDVIGIAGNKMQHIRNAF